MEQSQENRSARGRGRPFQFGLRTLLVAVTVVALVCMFFFALPDAVSGGLGFAMIWLTPVIFLTTAVYARGNLQAFCLGAVIPAISLLLPLWMIDSLDVTTDPFEMEEFLSDLASADPDLKCLLAISWEISLACGMVSLLVAWGLQWQRRGRHNDHGLG